MEKDSSFEERKVCVVESFMSDAMYRKELYYKEELVDSKKG